MIDNAADCDTAEAELSDDIDERCFRVFEPIRTTKYNAAVLRVHELERQLDKVQVADLQLKNDLTEQLEQANEARIAVQREELAMTDEERARLFADDSRANEGRDAYNATRRKSRATANAAPSKMTPEQRKRHTANLAADRQFRRAKSVAGWSEDQIDEAIAERRARRVRQNVAEMSVPAPQIWGDHTLYPKQFFSYH